jgi:3-oxoacyl-[acyl-carrier-protein] synthase II
MENNKRVVITGIGPIASTGIGKEMFWKGIVDRKTGLNTREFAVDVDCWGKFPVHAVENFDFKRFHVNKLALAYMNEWKEEEPPIDLQYIIGAVSLAIEDSGINYEAEENGLGLVLTHENMGLMPFMLKLSQISYETLQSKEGSQLSKKEFYEKIYNDCLKSGYDVQTFMSLFHVAKAFNIHNYSLFINNACASGLYALENASQIIKCNQSTAVVVAASEYSDIYKYLWFRDIGLYSEDGKIRPFCEDSNGLVFGDGGVGIVLEDLEHAEKRNAHIYAEYLGGGFHMEGWKVTMPQIGSDSYQKAIAKALQQSNISKDEIELLCPHGVGSQTIDCYEAKAITDVFGLNPEQPLISSYKPYIGHNLGGSALMEAAILLLSLDNETILPTLNTRNVNPMFNISLVKDLSKSKVNTAMKICGAFAGYNSAVVFKRVN